MYFLRTFAITAVLELTMLDYLVQGFTVQQIMRKKGRHTARRHDLHLSDFKYYLPTNKLKYLESGNVHNQHPMDTIVRNAYSTGINSTPSYKIVVSISKKVDKTEDNVGSILKNYGTVLKSTTKTKNINGNIGDTAAETSKLQNIANSFINAKRRNFYNATAIKKDIKFENATYCNTNINGTYKIMPLLESLRKMLLALEKLLIIATNATNTVKNKTDNISVIGLENRLNTTSPHETNEVSIMVNDIVAAYKKTFDQESANKTDAKLKYITPSRADIAINEKYITSSSDKIDDAIENLLNMEIIRDSEEHLQYLDDTESVSAQAESTRLYKWCLRLISAEKTGDRKNFDTLIKSNNVKETLSKALNVEIDIKAENKKNTSQQENEEVNMTNFINGVLDCIGFVNTMQSLYQPRK